MHSSLRGIDECPNTDQGRISINSGNFFSKNNLMEVYLHPADKEGNMAISPNNGAFLLNLSFPVVNFYIALQSVNSNN